MNEPASSPPSPLLRVLRLAGDVRPGEARLVVGFAAQLFVLMVGYYVLKSLREPLLLASGTAELKSYAAAAQALVLIGFIPAYAFVASRLRPIRLLAATGVVFGGVLLLFAPATFRVGSAATPERAADAELVVADFLSTGFLFYVWVGIFSVATIAQFWSLANDLYRRVDGERLFPVITLGATIGAASGSFVASGLFRAGFDAGALLFVACGMYALHIVGCMALARRAGQPRPSALEAGESSAESQPPVPSLVEGMRAILASRYAFTMAALLLLLNFVNTTGEYILTVMVKAEAVRLVDLGQIESQGAFIGAFYGDFFGVVNLISIALQALLASRLVRWFGVRGLVYALPVVAFGVYGLVALGVAFPVFRYAKMAENASDYSLMNTARNMLWLPTSRAEKYVAKQAVDTFIVRFGDVLSAGLVLVGVSLAWSPRGFAFVNVGLIVVWALVAVRVARAYDRRAKASDGGAAI